MEMVYNWGLNILTSVIWFLFHWHSMAQRALSAIELMEETKLTCALHNYNQKNIFNVQEQLTPYY